jgi:hypothetical protein
MKLRSHAVEREDNFLENETFQWVPRRVSAVVCDFALAKVPALQPSVLGPYNLPLIK